MLRRLLSGAVAAALVIGMAGSAQAMNAGLYTLTLTNARGSRSEAASLTGSGSTFTLAVSDSSGSFSLPLTVSGGALHGSGTRSGYSLSLTGSATGTGATGTGTASKDGHSTPLTFTLAPRGTNIAHEPMRDTQANDYHGTIFGIFYYLIFGFPEDSPENQRAVAGVRG